MSDTNTEANRRRIIASVCRHPIAKEICIRRGSELLRVIGEVEKLREQKLASRKDAGRHQPSSLEPKPSASSQPMKRKRKDEDAAAPASPAKRKKANLAAVDDNHVPEYRLTTRELQSRFGKARQKQAGGVEDEVPTS